MAVGLICGCIVTGLSSALITYAISKAGRVIRDSTDWGS